MLSIQDLIILSCKSLVANKLRSTLTALGVFMGVGAVNATLQVGDISRAVIAEQLAARDAPQVQIGSYYIEVEGRSINLTDMTYLQRNIQNITAISGINRFGGYENKVFFQAQEAQPQMFAVTQDYLKTTGRKLLKGRFLNSNDFTKYRPVIVIDKVLAEQLFQQENPLEQQLFSDGRLYLIVGVIESKISFGEEPKGMILLPISIYSAMTGMENIESISIRPLYPEKMEEIKTKAEELLKKRLPNAEVYAYSNIEEIVAQKQTLEMASQGLTVVGMIALLIGGVGITNITIAAVIERTAEIGLRRAIGATKSEILWQFILEAAILSLFGGITAVTAVHGITTVVAQTFSLPYKFELKTVSLSLGSALLVGVGAGFFPALRASQLDPVKALRSS
ncbi:MAG: FtsX-like permease family protein [Richelia sp. RM2_1_2]|nr:FtsX-like permease family protein [Richelia sp. SM1_7_0]NJN10010.1 FtsX-like permease family protein [Richelia sp. RM1_1_1]NJO28224.1 FtsX-like permease family protein [Richelia sp. SL_2_1]NJO60126.1 FtsX-like permease family protein [Richelia sp. RM2_1_2]